MKKLCIHQQYFGSWVRDKTKMPISVIKEGKLLNPQKAMWDFSFL
jgi:hypothetical protein